MIAEKWTQLCDAVESYCQSIGQEMPTIIAVSKTKSLEDVMEAWDAGARHFGENYAQELVAKATVLPNAKWHFIGHLQSGHAKKVATHASVIHTLDSRRLADKLASVQYSGDLMIQVNISAEVTKSGVVNDLETIKELVSYVRAKTLHVTGLMAIGNPTWDIPERIRRYKELQQLNRDLGLSMLSLGMSQDWREAVEAGATHLRIGTEIFGPRN